MWAIRTGSASVMMRNRRSRGFRFGIGGPDLGDVGKSDHDPVNAVVRGAVGWDAHQECVLAIIAAHFFPQRFKIAQNTLAQIGQAAIS